MSDAAGWVWLSLLVAPATRRLQQIVARYGDAETAYGERGSKEFAAVLKPSRHNADLDEAMLRAQAIVAECAAKSIEIIPLDDERYPARLRECYCAPAVLYATGDVSVLNAPCIAGVGTRSLSQYGREATAAICAPLAASGAVLVSGLAHGIDAEVHKAALKAGGKTVAVVGTAIDNTYPANHVELRRLIEHNGAVIGEYPPNAPYSQGAFPQRNRIIAGMSMAVMLFEAAAKSGTMITANWALEFSREVLCVPGSIFSKQSEGTNLLISQGATPILSASDVFSALGLAENKRERRELADKSEPKLYGIQDLIYNTLKAGPMSVDELTESLGYPPSAVVAAVSELEIDGIVNCTAGICSIKK